MNNEVDISNNNCAICFEKILNNINSCVTDCCHSFHTNCLIKAISFTGYNCPLCRKIFENGLKVEQYNPLSNYNMISYNDVDYSDSETIVSDENEQYEFVSSDLYDSNSTLNSHHTNRYRIIPSIYYITQKLISQSYPLENFICLALMEHDEYREEQSSFVSSNTNLYNTIKNIINEYRLEQENSIF
jgi:hypothetical protein